MTVINIYDMNFNLLGVIDSFVSVIWRPAYYDVGDFEIYMGASKEVINLLKRNRLAVRNTDVTVGANGKVTYKNVMLIKNISIITDVENGDFISVTGKELKFLLHQRIVWSQTNLSTTAEAGIRKLVNTNAINPSNTNRKIPNLALASSSGLSDDIDLQITGDNLDTAICDICKSYDYGWEIYGFDGKYMVRVYKGLDRSYNQSERPYVVFSDTYENLFNTEYELNTEEYANTALIGGEGEGKARTYTTVRDYVGLNRYELFVDARDISSNKGSEDEIPETTYIKLLQQRGREKLAEAAYTEGFSGEVLTTGNYKYGEDFNVGDTVTVINSYGITKNVMVLSAIESEDENGVTLIPQFNLGGA